MSDKRRATYRGLIADDETSARLSAVDEELPRGRAARRKPDPTSRAYRGGHKVGTWIGAGLAILVAAVVICCMAWGAVALVLSVAP